MLIIFCVLKYNNIKNKNQVTTISSFLFACLMYYTVVPILILRSKDVDVTNKYIETIILSSPRDVLIVSLFIILFIFFSVIGYSIKSKKVLKDKYTLNYGKWEQALKFISWFTFIVGGISFIMYVNAFGGISNLLRSAEYLRSFNSSSTTIISYWASLFVIPSRYIIVTPISSLILCQRKHKYYLVYRLMFLISLIMSITFLLSNAGRAPIIFLLIIFLVPLIKLVTKHVWKLAILIGIIFIPVLNFMDSLFLYFANGYWLSNEDNNNNFIIQFAHPFSNILNMQKIVDVTGLRYGKDFITGFLNIIPSVNFEPSFAATSYFYGGKLWNITGGTPNDIITFSYLQGKLFSIIIFALFFGMLLALIDNILKQLSSSYAQTVFKVAIIVGIFGYVINADIVSLVRNQVQLTFLLLTLLYSLERGVVK